MDTIKRTDSIGSIDTYNQECIRDSMHDTDSMRTIDSMHDTDDMHTIHSMHIP